MPVHKQFNNHISIDPKDSTLGNIQTMRYVKCQTYLSISLVLYEKLRVLAIMIKIRVRTFYVVFC